MRERLRSVAWRSSMVSAAAVAFLTLPGCGDDDGPGPNFTPGTAPLASVVFCDIEDRSVVPHCATAEEKILGIPLAQSAIALTRLQSTKIGLDYSPEAMAALGCGSEPVAIVFLGRFPDGYPVCLNCGEVIGPVYADANAACVAKCLDLNGGFENPPQPGVVDFCGSHARTSTNAGSCFDGACTDGGALRTDFVDPRRTPEPVIWTDTQNVTLGNPDTNTLIRTPPDDGTFSAGAASTQLITRGDGYVEFTARETNTNRVLGLAMGAPPDTVYSDLDIAFGIRLAPKPGDPAQGFVKISENGTLVPAPDGNVDSAFASFAMGDRLRVAVTDNHNGNASISYLLIPAACPPMVCTGVPLRTTGPAPYPFRVDATLGESNSTLADVRIVRIR